MQFDRPRYKHGQHFNPDFQGDYAIAKKDNVFRIINKKGEILHDFDAINTPLPELIYHEDSAQGYYTIKIHFLDKDQTVYQVFDPKMEKIIGGEYDYIDPRPHYTSYQIQEGKKVGLMDLNGKVILEPTYAAIIVDHSNSSHYKVINNLVPVEGNFGLNKPKKIDHKAILAQKEGLIDQNGAVIFPVKYNQIATYDSSSLVVGKYNVATQSMRYGLVDYEDNVLIPIEYESLSLFKDSLAIASKVRLEDGEAIWEYGFINEENEVVIPFQYYLITQHFEEGQAIVKVKNGNHIKDVIILKPDK